MKIGMVCYPTYGGSGVVATQLGEALADKGHEVHFISYERPFKLKGFHENLLLHEVPISDYPLFKYQPYTASLASVIAQVVKLHGLDVIHAHYAIPHTVSAYLAKQMLKEQAIPIITTLHGTDVTVLSENQQFYDITKFCLDESEGVTAVSQSLTKQTEACFELYGKVETIYNFVDLEEYKRIECQGLRQHYAPRDEKIVLHISNFRPVKRTLDVIRIFAEICKRVPARLLLVGDGPDRRAAELLSLELGISRQVAFLGKQDYIVQLLSVADLFLLPSEQESFGLAALEAMACQVPVIATLVGGIPEVVKHGQTGYLADLGDIKTMAAYGVSILESPTLGQQLGQQARALVADRFSKEIIVKAYENYYERLCR